jgi:hypothetical protein
LKQLALAAVVVGCLFLVAPAYGQATRTWVSAVGDDVNPCSRTAPCKTFAGAISNTAIGGEIDAMDDSGFGSVTITKSITIDGGGHHASILASGTNGININIAPNANDPNRRVVIRGVSINGTGSSGTVGTNTGLRGIFVTGNGAASLDIENVRVANFAQHGIDLRPGAAAPDLDASLDNVIVSDVFGNALQVVAPDTAHQIRVVVRNSTLRRAQGTNSDPAGETGAGLLADTGAHVWLTGTTIFDNLIGIRTLGRNGGGGVVDSYCDNQIAGNADNGQAPNQLCPQPAPAPAAPAAPAPVTVTKEVPAPERCAVPDLSGLTLTNARRMLVATNCKLGTVTRKRTKRRSRIGKVLVQGDKRGTSLAPGAAVAITIGRR